MYGVGQGGGWGGGGQEDGGWGLKDGRGRGWGPWDAKQIRLNVQA